MNNRTTKAFLAAIAVLLCLNLIAQVGFSEPLKEGGGHQRYSISMVPGTVDSYYAILLDTETGETWSTKGFSNSWNTPFAGGPPKAAKKSAPPQ